MDKDNTIITNSGVAPDHVGPVEPKITEVILEPAEPSSTDGDFLGGSCKMVELEEPMPKTSVNSWDDVLARENLINWAKNEDGSISKKALMKWFLDVDGGPAQDITAYRYPVGVIDKESGVPRYCPVAMDHSWSLADGSKTGIANRYIQKKIIFLKNREGFPLTAEQDDFVNRHMGSSGNIPETSVMSEGDSGEIILNEPYEGIMYNAAPSVPGILDETDEYIDVSVIPMREGVFTGTDGIPTLKLFDEFKNDAHWLEGQAILPTHTGPTEIVTYKHDRKGKLLNVKVRPETKDVIATARYYKSKLSPESIQKIKSGQPYDGSIAYTTNTVPISGDWTAPDGSKIHYNAVEKDGYHFYHFAEVGEGACSVSRGCGFLLNSAKPDIVQLDGIKEPIKLNGNFWEPAVLAYLEKLNNELIIAKGNEIETKRLKADIDKWSKLLDRLNGKQNASPIELTLNSPTVNDSEIPGETSKSNSTEVKPLEAVEEIQKESNNIKINSEFNMIEETKETTKGMVEDDEGTKCFPFQMKDGICQKEEEVEEEEEMPKENSVQVEVTIPEEFTQKMNAAISENESLKSALADQTQKLNAVMAQVEDLIQKQNESEESKRAAMEKRDFESFVIRLNQANRTPELAKKHYEGFKENGWAYFDENPKILYNSGPITMKAMGVASSAGASELEMARKTLKKTLSGKA